MHAKTAKRADPMLAAQFSALLSALTDRVIPFRVEFVDLGLSHTAALMLQQAVYWSLRTEREDRMFYKTCKDWYDELRLTRHQQAGARSELRGTDYWIEQRKEVPAQLYFRVDLERLYGALIQISENRQTGLRKPANQSSENRISGRPKSGKHLSLSESTSLEVAFRSPLSSQDAVRVPVEEKACGSRIALPKLEAVSKVRDGLAGGVHLTDMWNAIRDSQNLGWSIEDTFKEAAHRAALTLCDYKRGEMMEIGVDEIERAVMLRYAPLLPAFEAIQGRESRVQKIGEHIENATISEARRLKAQRDGHSDQKQTVLKF